MLISFVIAYFADFLFFSGNFSDYTLASRCNNTTHTGFVSKWISTSVYFGQDHLITFCSEMVEREFPKINYDQAVEELEQWSLSHGLIMYPENYQGYSGDLAPVTLFPTPFPKKEFTKALEVQKAFNELYSKVADDETFMAAAMEDLIESDRDFSGRLWKTYLKAKEVGIVQPVSLGLVRSDYMLDQISGGIKQIEYNSIAVSFGGLSPKVGQLHRYLNKIGVYGEPQYYDEKQLAVSDSGNKLASGLAAAVKQYSVDGSIVLVVVQEGERNVFDQRALQNSLVDRHGVRSRRITFKEIPLLTSQDSTTRKLVYKPTNEEVAVVYYRTGYSPEDYSSDADWKVRLDLETSLAIKCPTVLSQLSGSKKVQQLLTNKSIVSKYLAYDLELLLSTFVGIYSLDETPQGKHAQKLALESPGKYVLKPQREGGGNNIYKEDIPAFLRSIPQSHWSGYILMDLIDPPQHENKVVKHHKVYHEKIMSELGIFGTILWDSKTGKIFANTSDDYLLRSKFSSSNEGGVAAGFGCIDSVYLT